MHFTVEFINWDINGYVIEMKRVKKMGIGIEVHEFENEVVESQAIKWEEARICELGNQKIKFRTPRIPAKKYYEKLGVKEHISIDLNGKNGAIPLDLDYTIPDELVDRFDIVTNYGTLEHVNNQYQAFENMHSMCKIGGVMLHSLPPIDNWKGHGRYYYTENFIEQLAASCGYEIVNDIKRVRRKGEEGKELLQVAFIKKTPEFIDEETFHRLDYQDTKDKSTTGNYTQKKMSICKRLFQIK